MSGYNKPASLRLLLPVFGLFVAAALFAQGPRLSRELLLRSQFRYATGLGGGKFVFRADDSYSAEYASEGIYWFDEGSYSISGDRLLLLPEFCRQDENGSIIPCEQSLGRASCVLNETPADLYFQTHLVCTSEANRELLYTGEENRQVKVSLIDRRVPAGAARVFQGQRVVTMGMARGRTTTSVKIRRAPSVNAEAVQYTAELFGSEAVNAVPSGTELTVIARSERKAVVQSWNNYWYLVNVGAMQEVWMYGEFVRLE